MIRHSQLIQLPRYTWAGNSGPENETDRAADGTADAPQPAIVWGARGHAKVLNEFLPQLGLQIAAVFDNDPQARSPISGVPLFHGVDGFTDWRSTRVEEQITGLVAIGGQHGGAREEILSLFRSHGVCVPAVAHPTAFVARDAQVADGCQVLASASVCTEVRTGEGCIVNTGASIDHE
ncbi:MAG: hypothetical protein VB858_14445, partial [Planctomycetaceae bacterium]